MMRLVMDTRSLVSLPSFVLVALALVASPASADTTICGTITTCQTQLVELERHGTRGRAQVGPIRALYADAQHGGREERQRAQEHTNVALRYVRLCTEGIRAQDARTGVTPQQLERCVQVEDLCAVATASDAPIGIESLRPECEQYAGANQERAAREAARRRDLERDEARAPCLTGTCDFGGVCRRFPELGNDSQFVVAWAAWVVLQKTDLSHAAQGVLEAYQELATHPQARAYLTDAWLRTLQGWAATEPARLVEGDGAQIDNFLAFTGDTEHEMEVQRMRMTAVSWACRNLARPDGMIWAYVVAYPGSAGSLRSCQATDAVLRRTVSERIATVSSYVQAEAARTDATPETVAAFRAELATRIATLRRDVCQKVVGVPVHTQCEAGASELATRGEAVAAQALRHSADAARRAECERARDSDAQTCVAGCSGSASCETRCRQRASRRRCR